jgi:hypothetical protein
MQWLIRIAGGNINVPSKLARYSLPRGVASDCPLLRASNEALLRARVPRAQRTSEVAPSLPSELAHPLFRDGG